MQINEPAFRAALGKPMRNEAVRERAQTAAHAAHVWHGRHQQLRDDIVRLLDQLEATDPVARSLRTRLFGPIRTLLRQHGGPATGGSMVRDTSPRAQTRLSPMQLVVLRYVAEGYTQEETASRLNVGLETVKTHMSGVRTALSAGNAAQAVHIGHQLGLLDSAVRAVDEPESIAGQVVAS
jgi:DNA-binding CsgD family transcriptional regulator